MNQRLDYKTLAPEVFDAMRGLETTVHRAGLDPTLLELVKTRVSQINGCAHCLDMHTKDARAAGETEQRLNLLAAWREAPCYSASERAALGWAEAVTTIAAGTPDDPLYAELERHFEPKAIVDLTLAIVAINGWNRLAISFRSETGSYRAGDVVKRPAPRTEAI